MTIDTVALVEDCVDGSRIREIVVDQHLTPQSIRALGSLGELEYFADFPRPFFRVISDTYQLKGVQGTTRIRLWARNDDALTVLDRIREILSGL